MASTPPLELVSLPSSPLVGVTVPEVCTMALSWTVRLTEPAGKALPNGLMLAFLSVPRIRMPPFPLESMTRSDPGPPWSEPYQVKAWPRTSIIASPRFVEAFVLIFVRLLMSRAKEAPTRIVDWLNWISLTVLRALSGSGAPRQVSALITRVPPPSMRHPPPLVSAVLRLFVLARTKVPGPSFHIVFDPEIVELIVAVTLESTTKFEGAPIIFSVPELIE